MILQVIDIFYMHVVCFENRYDNFKSEKMHL